MKVPSRRQPAAGRANNLVNALYLAVLVTAAGVFYILSAAIMLGLMGAAYFLGAGFMVRGKSIEVLVIAGFIAWLVARGFLRRPREQPVGLKADPERFPRLFSLLAEVAQNVGTRQVDEVFLTPAASIAVHDRPGFLGLFGRSRRVLDLGVACLFDLTLQELKAILAHEYAHFTSRETLFRRFVARVLNGLAAALEEIQRGRFWKASPVYWSLRIYHFFFRYFASTFNRQREYYADELASRCYGGNVLASGLVRFACTSAFFEGPAYGGLFRLMLEGRMMRNLYSAFRAYSRTASPEDFERIRREVLKDRSGLLDMQPCPARRIARIRSLNRRPVSDPRSARDVFENPVAVEEELTALLTGALMGGTGLLEALRNDGATGDAD